MGRGGGGGGVSTGWFGRLGGTREREREREGCGVRRRTVWGGREGVCSFR